MIKQLLSILTTIEIDYFEAVFLLNIDEKHTTSFTSDFKPPGIPRIFWQ